MPAGVVGFLLAGLLAAFMSNFAATINAAPAYLVNDIYKRFINPNPPRARTCLLSRVASIVVLVIGILFGLLTRRITDVMLWLVGALYAGYLMANVLKWYWWRFNGYGYCWGMVAGHGRRDGRAEPPRNTRPRHSVIRFTRSPSILVFSLGGLPARHAG